MAMKLLNLLMWLLSYFVLLIPKAHNEIASYVLVGVSVFLFMVGYINSRELVLNFKKYFGHGFIYIFRLLFGFIPLLYGIYRIYAYSDSFHNMGIYCVFLIESIAILVGLDEKDERVCEYRLLGYTFSVFSTALFLLTIGYIIYTVNLRDDELNISFIFFSLFTAFFYAISSLKHNVIRKIWGIRESTTELCKKFEKTRTQLGAPWIGQVKNKKNCIIYGPDTNGIYIYAFKGFLGRLIICLEDNTSLLDEFMMVQHVVDSDDPNVNPTPNKKLDKLDLVGCYAYMFKIYKKEGKCSWSVKKYIRHERMKD
ncbi:MAG: hypothetical protein K5656_10835 [Lachnospiraceae bacterium]|nr:hypothetical protein [Lachnospiraceae bacterium]